MSVVLMEFNEHFVPDRESLFYPPWLNLGQRTGAVLKVCGSFPYVKVLIYYCEKLHYKEKS